MGCVEDWEGFGVDCFAGEEEGCVMRAFSHRVGKDELRPLLHEKLVWFAEFEGEAEP